MTDSAETPQPTNEGEGQEESSIARLVTIGQDSLILIKLPENVPNDYQVVAKIFTAESTDEIEPKSTGKEGISIGCGCKRLGCACNSLKISPF